MSELFHSFIGLPRSGKTTFLAALWHLINAGECQTGLVVTDLIGNTAHLDEIADRWRRCEETTRTSMAEEKAVTMHVVECSSGSRYALTFPDLSGETFDAQIRTRVCTQAYVDDQNRDGALALFITANRGSDGIAITDLPPMVRGFVSADDTQAEVPAWRSEFIPEQVRIVELLQFLQSAPFRRRHRRLALIISAWDVVGDRKVTPLEWLAMEMPLLSQFLKTNADWFTLRVFGVSAQGGNVRGEDKIALLQLSPSDRVVCLDEGGGGVDFTEPVRWMTRET